MTQPQWSGTDLRWIVDGDEEDRNTISSLAVLGTEERAAALERFTTAAKEGGTKEAHLLALALSAAGLHESAIDVFRRLLRSDPACVPARLNLAVAYLMIDLPGLALEELEQAANVSAEGPLANLARDRLAHLQQRRAAQLADMRFRELRVAALREKDEHGEAEAADYCHLGHLLFTLVPEPTSEVEVDDAILALEQACTAAPHDLQVHEDLTIAYRAAGRMDDMAETFRVLEQIAPHSGQLERARLDRVSPAADHAVLWRKFQLIQQVLADDAPSPAAVEEIRKLAKQLPGNPDYKAMLMFAVWGQGDLDEAVRIADELVRVGNLSHNIHFNVAQVYRAAANYSEAERHLRAAEDTAADEADRADVAALRKLLKADGHA